MVGIAFVFISDGCTGLVGVGVSLRLGAGMRVCVDAGVEDPGTRGSLRPKVGPAKAEDGGMMDWVSQGGPERLHENL